MVAGFFEWEEYRAEKGADYAPVEKWGKDHWSTLAYLETRTVDYDGVIDNRHMRCNPRLHREFAHHWSGGNYPTILNGEETLDNHDDWSCLEDMVAAGYLQVWFRRASTNIFGNSEAKVKLTARGKVISTILRAFKAEGGNFGEFTVELVPEHLK